MVNKNPMDRKKISRNEVRSNYNKTYESSDHLRDSDNSYEWVLNCLKPSPGSIILDIACGFGILLEKAKESWIAMD